jgi:hypothetical protein
MRILEDPSEETSRTMQVPPPSRKCVSTAFATFALVFGCILAGMPVATAPTANLSGGMRIPSASASLILACGGACPGLCPCPSELNVGQHVQPLNLS